MVRLINVDVEGRILELEDCMVVDLTVLLVSEVVERSDVDKVDDVVDVVSVVGGGGGGGCSVVSGTFMGSGFAEVVSGALVVGTGSGSAAGAGCGDGEGDGEGFGSGEGAGCTAGGALPTRRIGAAAFALNNP